MNPIENNVLVRTCKMCFKRKKITSVLGSGEVFFQEPYQCISCCFKPVQVVQQRPESSSKIIENKLDAKMKPSTNTSTETRNIIQSNVIVVKGENENPGNFGNTADPEFVNPFGFEQPMKKIKLEDQSSEIERLNEIIKNLKEENIKLNKKVSEFTDVREEFLKLQKMVNDLEVKVQQKNQKIRKCLF